MVARHCESHFRLAHGKGLDGAGGGMIRTHPGSGQPPLKSRTVFADIVQQSR